MLPLLQQVFKASITITVFVIVMMIIIEYLGILSKGRMFDRLKKTGTGNVLMGAILGLIPGCLGTYTGVSLYVHQLINFPALVTMLIATSGDEAFIMMAAMPQKALIIFGILLLTAISTGLVLSIFYKNKFFKPQRKNHLQIHDSDIDCVIFNRKKIIDSWKNISFQRAFLLGSMTIFIFYFLFTDSAHNHGILPAFPGTHIEEQDHQHIHASHEHDTHHQHNHHINDEQATHSDHGETFWNWYKVSIFLVTLISFLIIGTVPEHFLNKHIWGHVLKIHFLRVFLWTFGTMLFLGIGLEYFHMEAWISSNYYVLLLVAVLIGIIPESGPHLVFISLYLSGMLPLSILIANSIVQDGHGALPLLAESRKHFLKAKLANMLVGLLVGVSGIIMGW